MASDFVSLKILLVLPLKLAGLLIFAELEGQHFGLVQLSCRMGVFTVEVRLTRRACFLLVVWRCSKVAVWNLFLNSCPCGKSPSGWVLVRTGSERQPLRDDTRSGNYRYLYACYFYLISGMSPKRVISALGLAGSGKNSLTSEKVPKMQLVFLLCSW